MQTSDHAIALARPKGMTPQRVTGLIFAGLLQAALILALIEGLNIKVWPTPVTGTTGTVIKTAPSKPGPPPTLNMHEPTLNNPVEPRFVIDNGQPQQGGLTTVYGPPQPPSYDQAATAVGDTHTTPPYPPLAIRLSEEGSVRLHLTISAQGYVMDAAVVRSSGYEDLDLAARNWIMAHWRYRPAMRGGAATASAADIQVRFDLKNAH